MNHTKKIAKECMRGNKKQNRILHLGLCSLCIFSMMLLLFQVSFLEYRQEEVEKQYGAWSGAVYNADVEICDFLKQSPLPDLADSLPAYQFFPARKLPHLLFQYKQKNHPERSLNP